MSRRMGGFPPSPPPPPGGGQPPPPPRDGFPPPGGGGWAGPPGGPGAPGAAPPGPFGAPGSYAAPPGYGYPGVPVKAGFWTRFAAYLIDGILVGLFGIPAQVALTTGSTKIEPCSIDRSGNFDPSGSVDNGLCEVPTGTTWAIFGILLAIALVAGIIYFAKLEGGSGQTVGKRALGIRVVDARTGGSIGTGRGVGRYFARILSALVCMLGYLWMLWDPEKQTWHDKMVTSYVVKV
jgi:uncharacterized RDD family membrane protein YckC